MSQRFFNLIRNGDTAQVAAAAEEDGALIQARDAQGVSAFLCAIYNRQPLIRDFLLAHLPTLTLFEASAAGDCGRMEALLREDATLVYQTSADGWAPLHLAAGFGGDSAVALLLEHGAHVHQVSHNPVRGQPLHACAGISRDLDTAALLIMHGADVNATQGGGYTPLHLAAAAGASELVQLLLSYGADAGRLCGQKKTPERYARERGHLDVAGLLASSRGQ